MPTVGKPPRLRMPGFLRQRRPAGWLSFTRACLKRYAGFLRLLEFFLPEHTCLQGAAMNSDHPDSWQAAAGHTAQPRIVVVHSCEPCADPDGHECSSQNRVAARVAALMGCRYGGEYDAGAAYDLPLYFVPRETVPDMAQAALLGIRGEHDLFGGVVPHPYVGTKVITHPLLRPGCAAPPGWAPAFGEQVRDVTLPGYSAFSRDDARAAGLALLADGAVRIKLASGIGGGGQTVAADADALDAQLDALDDAQLRDGGVVLERNLNQVVTHSVGQVRVGRHLASYCGIQRLTRNNAGDEVYGGSDLLVARGDFEALLALPHADEVHLAVAQACAYHRAALACFPGLLASRCNYDVAQGVDDGGAWRSGVLEQSWRIGGATGAELAALAAFQADPALGVVRAATIEVYCGATPPPDAEVYFNGVDRLVGPITKYTRTMPYAHP
jgi:hypothetical protein